MSDTTNENIRTLYNNNITNFILRIDFEHRFRYDIEDVVKTIQPRFDKTEKRFSHQKINFTKQEVNYSATFEDIASTVLYSEASKGSLTFSPEPPSIVFETRRYVSKEVYEDLFQELSNYFSSNYPDDLTARIGMRFINTFPVKTDRDFSKYFSSPYSSLVRSVSKKENLCRTLIQQEITFDGNRARIAYGLLNKYYPSVIVSKDLTLDIDSYTERRMLFADWPETLSELNHSAYEHFKDMINPRYIEFLKEQNV